MEINLSVEYRTLNLKTMQRINFGNAITKNGLVLIIIAILYICIMETKKKIKDLYRSLLPVYQTEVLNELLAEHELDGVLLDQAKDVVKGKRPKKPCPVCSSTNVYKRGKQNGSQTYQCNDCKKNYRDTTGTALYNIQKKEKWQSYLDLMERGTPIKVIAAKLGISIQTSFDWRHKVLSSLEQFIPDNLANTVECDELEFSISNKGDRNLERKPRKRASDFKRNKDKGVVSTVQVVAAVERNTGHKIFKVVESKRLTKEQISKVLDGKIEDGATLITDKHPSYKAYAKSNEKIKHKRLLAKDHVDKKDKTIHLQKVNNVHSQVRDFIRPFNGVSSKYLQNYLNWYAYKKKVNNSKTTLKMWFVAILMSENAYGIYRLFKQNDMIIRT